MSLRRIHEEEEKNWGKFFPLIETFSVEPEVFSVIYDRNADSTYTAQMPEPFGFVSGSGETPEEAKEELLNKIKHAESD
jgi:hypothetical protein